MSFRGQQLVELSAGSRLSQDLQQPPGMAARFSLQPLKQRKLGGVGFAGDNPGVGGQRNGVRLQELTRGAGGRGEELLLPGQLVFTGGRSPVEPLEISFQPGDELFVLAVELPRLAIFLQLCLAGRFGMSQEEQAGSFASHVGGKALVQLSP